MRHRASLTVSSIAALLVLAAGLGTPAHAQKGAASSGPAGGQGGGGTAYFESQMLAYGALNQVAEATAKEVCRSISDKPATVIIFDQNSFQNLLAWQSFVASAEALNEAYKTLLNGPAVAGLSLQDLFKNESQKRFPAAAATAAGAGVSLSDVASVITAISATTTENPSGFTISDTTMAVSLAHQFGRLDSCHKVNLIYIPLFGSFPNVVSAQKVVLNALAELNKTRQKIQNNSDFFATNSNTDIKYLLFSDLNSSYDALLKSLLPATQSGGGSQGGGASPPGPSGGGAGGNASPAGGAPGGQASGSGSAVSLLQGAMLQELLRQPSTYILYADVVAAGGTQRDIRNLLTIIFSGDLLSYSGGVIANVALLQACHNDSDVDAHFKAMTGIDIPPADKSTCSNQAQTDRPCEVKLIFADTLRYRTGFHTVKEPSQSDTLEPTDAGDNLDSFCDSHHEPGSCTPHGNCRNRCPRPNP